MSKKLLITSGCSFSECTHPWLQTWPQHLAKYLTPYDHISKAMGSQGNGLISRGIIYQIIESLKTHNSDDILVGIMWSGPTRHEVYDDGNINFSHNIDGWMHNPTKFIENAKNNWIILNSHWQNKYAKQFYGSDLFNEIGSFIASYEHILRVQWFLKLHNIKYFMTTYTSEVFPIDIINHDDVTHLYQLIDFNQFLPIDGEYEWCRDFSREDFPIIGDNHPGASQHKLFTEKVIIPFLNSKGLI